MRRSVQSAVFHEQMTHLVMSSFEYGSGASSGIGVATCVMIRTLRNISSVCRDYDLESSFSSSDVIDEGEQKPSSNRSIPKWFVYQVHLLTSQ